MYRQSESYISSTCRHKVVNFGQLMAEICWRVCGTPANFNRFRVLPSLLLRCRSPEANQTVHHVRPCPEGRYSRKVVNGGRSYDRSYAELTTSVVIHERNRTYDRTQIRSQIYDIPGGVVNWCQMIVNRPRRVTGRRFVRYL